MTTQYRSGYPLLVLHVGCIRRGPVRDGYAGGFLMHSKVHKTITVLAAAVFAVGVAIGLTVA